MSLKGRTLFITGASRGIGLAIAKRAAQDGANVAVVAKTEQSNPRLPGTLYTAADEASGSPLTTTRTPASRNATRMPAPPARYMSRGLRLARVQSRTGGAQTST